MKANSTYFNIKPLQTFLTSVSDQVSGRSGHIRAAMRRWGPVYSAFAKRRFNSLSRGGTDHKGVSWKPLAPATIAGRRKGKGKKVKTRRAGTTSTTTVAKGQVSILKDTGTLFKALTIGASGNLFKDIPGGVRFGFGGGAAHGNSGMTIAQIARAHDQGTGKLPQRKILGPPDKPTINRMMLLLRAGVKSEMSKNSKGLRRK